MKRREFVASASCFFTLGSGCLGVGSGNSTDIIIQNEGDEFKNITIQVRKQSNDYLLLDESFDIEPSSSKRYDDVVSDFEVMVDIRMRNGPENAYEWYDDEHNSMLLIINIESDSITFSEGMR